jgi:hypothetical protein
MYCQIKYANPWYSLSVKGQELGYMFLVVTIKTDLDIK